MLDLKTWEALKIAQNNLKDEIFRGILGEETKELTTVLIAIIFCWGQTGLGGAMGKITIRCEQ